MCTGEWFSGASLLEHPGGDPCFLSWKGARRSVCGLDLFRFCHTTETQKRGIRHSVTKPVMALSEKARAKIYRVKHADKVRAKDAERKRKSRLKVIEQDKNPTWPTDPAQAVADWAAESLVVPPGHPNEGQPFVLPDYGVAFLQDALSVDCNEACLLVARKNSKSGIIACLLTACLVGPLRRLGWRAGVVSLSKEKATELKRQVEGIVQASGLHGIKFLRTASPGIVSKWGTVDILSSGSDAGAASGFDLSIVDEIGLLRERDRALISGMRSAVSAKGGRFVSLSVVGSGPFVPEILERHRRGDDPGLAVHLYQSDASKPIEDEDNWALSNPGLACGIKSLDYMRSESRRVGITVSDQGSFRSLDLNLPGAPSREMLCTPDDWANCEVDTLPPRSGPVCLGIDLGGSSSMSALVGIWPSTGRLESWAALPDTPNLADRGSADGVGSLYERMQQRGELTLYSGRLVPVGEFLADCALRLDGCRVVAAGADRYRRSEALQALESAEINWPFHWRGTGASATADGSFDVRSFQKLVYSKRIKTRESLVLRSAIGESVITRKDGNPKLEKTRHHSRIDVLQAAVIAAGLSELSSVAPRRSFTYRGAV